MVLDAPIQTLTLRIALGWPQMPDRAALDSRRSTLANSLWPFKPVQRRSRRECRELAGSNENSPPAWNFQADKSAWQ
jgi:hypothetical protein